MGRPMTEAGKIRKQTSLKLDDALDLRRTINEVLLAYGMNVETDMQYTISEVSKEAVKKLKSVSLQHGWKNYAKGWTYEKKAGRRGVQKFTLYNKKHGPLTHLLENGHVKVLWGRSTNERVDGTPHIGQVNDWIAEELPKEVEKALNQTL